MDEGGDGGGAHCFTQCRPSNFSPSPLFSSVLPLLCSSSAARPPLLSLFLLPSVCVLSAAGPHPH